MSQFFTWIVCTDNCIFNRFETERLARDYLVQLIIHSPEVAEACRIEKMYRTIC